MNRKQIERVNEKSDRGLRKRLLANHDMKHWDDILEAHKHEILQNNLSIAG